MNQQNNAGKAPDRGDLPRPTTFFLSEAEHRAVLRVLRSHDAHNRSEALRKALGIDHSGARG